MFYSKRGIESLPVGSAREHYRPVSRVNFPRPIPMSRESRPQQVLAIIDAAVEWKNSSAGFSLWKLDEASKERRSSVTTNKERDKEVGIEERKNVSNRWKDRGKVEREQSDSFAKR